MRGKRGIGTYPLDAFDEVRRRRVQRRLIGPCETDSVQVDRDYRSVHREFTPATRTVNDTRGLAPLVDWMALYGVFWRERFANLKTLMKEINPWLRAQ